MTLQRMLSFCFYWKLALFKGANGYFLAGATAFLAFTDSDDWRSQRMVTVRMVIFVLIAAHKHLESFFDQTVARLRTSKHAEFPEENPNVNVQTPEKLQAEESSEAVQKEEK